MRGAGQTLPLRLRYPVVVLIALLLPGVASLMLRGWQEVGRRSLVLLAAIPVAFLVFGPLWGDVIFARSPKWLRDIGIWPFLAICVAVALYSLWRALQDRRVVIARLESSASGGPFDATGVARVRQTKSESIGYGCFAVAVLLLAIRFLALPALLGSTSSRAGWLAQVRAANMVTFLQASFDVGAVLLALLGAYLVWRGRRYGNSQERDGV